MPFLRSGMRRYLQFKKKKKNSAETDFFPELSTHVTLFKKPKEIQKQNA